MKLRTYCLACRKGTNNIASSKVLEINQGVVNVCMINQDF